MPFSGLVYIYLQDVSIGSCIHDLEIISKTGKPEDLENFVIYLRYSELEVPTVPYKETIKHPFTRVAHNTGSNHKNMLLACH